MDVGPWLDLPASIARTAVVEHLSRVLDPELDEPILELGFLQSLRVSDGLATVTLQLPTGWCAINFAFAMAEDLRAALLAVDGINRVTVRLGDHSSAEEIEAAVNSGKPFAEAFAGEAATGLVALRAGFLTKGFLVRQERLLRELRAAGLSAAAISALHVGDAPAEADSLRRYLERRAELGIDCSPTAALIVDQHGAAVPEERLECHYQRIRTVRVAMEANGLFCRAVLAKRRAPLQAPQARTGTGETHVQA